MKEPTSPDTLSYYLGECTMSSELKGLIFHYTFFMDYLKNKIKTKFYKIKKLKKFKEIIDNNYINHF